MRELLIFGGTTEGRRLADALAGRGIPHTVCVVSDYGEHLLGEDPIRRVCVGHLDSDQMAGLMGEGRFELAVDATHPYARQATQNIAAAARAAGLSCLRLLRESSALGEDVTVVPDIAAAVELLRRTTGNVLAATGSKELTCYTALPDFRARVYARVLPLAGAVEHCLELGFDPGHVLAMQGPFSQELNRALLRQWNIETLVTKDGGAVGGFAQKQAAARQEGVRLLVVDRPPEEGISLDALLEKLDAALEETI